MTLLISQNVLDFYWSSPYTFLKHYFVPIQIHSKTGESTYESVIAGRKESFLSFQTKGQSK